ncbi:MAG: hypothetical protein HFF18_04115 [Oscillospiraceae bacterium]|nr:hypothetical protein [Oscillospiraceae bacterium]
MLTFVLVVAPTVIAHELRTAAIALAIAVPVSTALDLAVPIGYAFAITAVNRMCSITAFFASTAAEVGFQHSALNGYFFYFAAAALLIAALMLFYPILSASSFLDGLVEFPSMHTLLGRRIAVLLRRERGQIQHSKAHRQGHEGREPAFGQILFLHGYLPFFAVFARMQSYPAAGLP